MAVTCVTFTACGGDDGDDNQSDGSTGIGVHRIDVQFSGNTTECNALNIFYAIKADGSYASLYENGNKLQLAASHTWQSKSSATCPLSLKMAVVPL